tara:strand:+ start:1424 stop:1840 length:417 start_codon:yes stop_codon:yes gene_type:complete
MARYKFKDLKKGQKVSFKIKLTSKMLDQFTKLSGDKSPLHTSKKFAKKYGFKNRLIHGMLIGSHYSKIIGILLPGNLSVEAQMNIKFHQPTYENDELSFKAKIIQLSNPYKICTVEIKTLNQNKKLVSSAESVVKLVE